MSGFAGRSGGGGRDGGRGGGGRDGGFGGGRDGGRGGGGRDGGGRDGGRGGRDGGRGGGGRGGSGRDGGFGGGRDGGRGGGRDGGRGGGRPLNRHMGQLSTIVGLAKNITDAEILRVINPSADSRAQRAALMARRYSMPAIEAWRVETPVGKRLPEGGVRANFFEIDTSKVNVELFHYNLNLYRENRDGTVSDDITTSEDSMEINSAFEHFLSIHPEFKTTTIAGKTIPVGVVFDGRTSLYSSHLLPFTTTDVDGQLSHEESIRAPRCDNDAAGRAYRIRITLVKIIRYPPDTDWSKLDAEQNRALDLVIHDFARKETIKDDPSWFVSGSKIFQAKQEVHRLRGAFIGLRGSYSSIRSCLAGLVLCVDMTVSCFLFGASAIDIMWTAAEYQNAEAFIKDCKAGSLHRQRIAMILDAIKSAQCRITHINFSKKIKGLGPPANSRESAFDFNGKKVTVADYFSLMCDDHERGGPYRNALGKSKALKHPYLPTINVGTTSHPMLVPPELVIIRPGQTRLNAVDGDMLAKIITLSAVVPEERFQYLKDGNSLVKLLKSDPTAAAFGLGSINGEPMSVNATLLPQAKLQYGGGSRVDPDLNGSWDTKDLKFITPAALAAGEKKIKTAVLLVSDQNGRIPPDCTPALVDQFIDIAIADCNSSGLLLGKHGTVTSCSESFDAIHEKLKQLVAEKVRLTIVMMCGKDSYNVIKFAGDSCGMLTSCVKLKNVLRTPRGMAFTMSMKLNTKLGGTRCCLVSRAATAGPSRIPVYQDPPASLSWVMDKACMFVGIDVSHSAQGSDKPSLAAVVASMDSRLAQFAACLSSQGKANEEMVTHLTEAMSSHFEAYKARNRGKMPEHIIVYRDGVSDGQFQQVIDFELPAIKTALDHQGYPDVKISIIVCQKRHQTRLVYQDGAEYINPCPGLVVDSTGGRKSIVNSNYNEFYLNSHAALLGTSRPCKYILIYDEIGFKLSEIELLTYWTTYLYCRANKSVSYATPAYYAHWASKRAKAIYAAGGTAADLDQITHKWMNTQGLATMFFV